MKYDLFLSYSSEDRYAIVNSLNTELISQGFIPWFDVKEIAWGDSIIEKIQEGISKSKFIIVFISETYLHKAWPLKELRSALGLQINGGPTILPILLGVKFQEIKNIHFLDT